MRGRLRMTEIDWWPQLLAALNYLAKHAVHVDRGERAQRLRAYVAELAEAQPQRRHGDIVRRLEGCYDVAGAECPIDVFQRDAEFLRHRFDRVGPLERVRDV